MHQNSFYKLFPPPRFLEMPAIGLDISDESIHFLELSPGKGGFVVKNFGEKKIPKEIIKSGEIKDTEKLSKILSNIGSKFSSNFINVSLPEQRAYLLKLRIPKIKRSEIRSSLELQLEDNVPISAGEAVFDYDIIEEREKDIEVVLSVFPSDIIESYINVFKSVGLVPLSFEIESQAIARSVVPYGDNGTFMVVDFGNTRTGISVVSEEIVRFTSTIDIGGSAISKSIEKLMSVSPEKAEEIKKERGITKNKEDNELFLTMMSIVGVLKEEINKHYIYWHTHKDQYGIKRPKIEKIILCGGDANLIGLPEYLSSGLHTPVELANVMANVNSFERYIPQIDFNKSLRYATSIGLALKRSN